MPGSDSLFGRLLFGQNPSVKEKLKNKMLRFENAMNIYLSVYNQLFDTCSEIEVEMAYRSHPTDEDRQLSPFYEKFLGLTSVDLQEELNRLLPVLRQHEKAIADARQTLESERAVLGLPPLLDAHPVFLS